MNGMNVMSPVGNNQNMNNNMGNMNMNGQQNNDNIVMVVPHSPNGNMVPNSPVRNSVVSNGPLSTTDVVASIPTPMGAVPLANLTGNQMGLPDVPKDCLRFLS